VHSQDFTAKGRSLRKRIKFSYDDDAKRRRPVETLSSQLEQVAIEFHSKVMLTWSSNPFWAKS